MLSLPFRTWNVKLVVGSQPSAFGQTLANRLKDFAEDGRPMADDGFVYLYPIELPGIRHG
jgi:hypothetical protein